MIFLFYNCTNLVNVNLKNWNTEKVAYMDFMFFYCNNLKSIYVSDLWKVNDNCSGDLIFEGCYNLVGQSGLVYDSFKKDKNYANYQTGYFTYKAHN